MFFLIPSFMKLLVFNGNLRNLCILELKFCVGECEWESINLLVCYIQNVYLCNCVGGRGVGWENIMFLSSL